MLKIYRDSILEAQRLLKTTDDVGHDFGHAERVARNARNIGKELGYGDIDLLEVCAWWHDIGRMYQTNHEKLSAKLLNKDLKMRGLDYKRRKRAYQAVYRHRWDMNPRTIQGRIIKDADKLDFISVERWNQRERHHQHDKNLANLGRLPLIRRKLYFNVSRILFDRRLNGFASNLETHGAKAAKTLVLQPT